MLLNSIIPKWNHEIWHAQWHKIHGVSYHETWQVPYLMHEMRQASKLSAKICLRTEFLLTQSYCFSSAGHENTDGLGDVVVLPRANVIKLFPPKFTNFRNKLECLSVASFSSQVKWLGGKARSRPLRWAHERKARYSITSKY
jgi:hypothetical protein